jgi:DHA1 family inner membrane transport protein
MAFFRNSAVNRINIHYGVQALASGAGGVFVVVYLLRAGVPLPGALLSMAGILAGRFLIRPIILPIAKRWGLKTTLVVGTLLIAIQFPVLALVHGVGWGLAALILSASVGDTFYWSSYHAYFAALGDEEHRGHQIGAREAIAAVIGIVAPLLGAWGLVTFGPSITFWAVGVAQALGVIPLIGLPNIPVAAQAPGSFRAARLGMLMFAADGWFVAGYYFVWQVALFVAVHENFAAYGGAMALAALVGAVGGLLLGRRIDMGHGLRMSFIAYGISASVVLLRAASIGSPWLAVAANAPGALVAALQSTAMMAPVYNMAKASPCPLRFHIATEGGWDIGCFSGCLLGAAIAASGRSLSYAMLLALIGSVASVVLLSVYYARLGAGEAAPATTA